MAAYFWFLAILSVGHVLFSDDHMKAVAECTWNEVKDTSIPGGRYTSAGSISECQGECMAAGDCQSIDLDIEGNCTLHTTQDGQRQTPGSTHFDYKCQVPEGCPWKEVDKPSVPSGILIPGVDTVEMCRDVCENTPDCWHVDWIDSARLCYLPVQPVVLRYERICDGGVTTNQPQTDTSYRPITDTSYQPITNTQYRATTFMTEPPVCKAKLDLVFVVDGSTSICRVPFSCENWKFNVQFIHKIVDGLTIGPDDTRVGLIMFSNRASVQFNLNTYTDQASLLSAIDKLKFPTGQTNTTGALKTLVSAAFTQAGRDRPDVPNVAIMITDGAPNIDVDQLPAAINAVRNSKIHMLVVGVTKGVKEDTVREISSLPQEINKTYFLATDYSSIDRVRGELQKETCDQATTTVAPRPLTSSEPPPLTSSEPPPCEAKLDLVFVVDGSTSICGVPFPCENWKFNVQFIHTIVDGLTIGPDDTRVGLIMFSTAASVEFNLNTYTDVASLLSAIDNLKFRTGKTNTTGALRTLVSAAFIPEAGDRWDIPNVSIMITDGVPNVEHKQLSAAIEVVQSSGISMLVVGVTDNVDKDIVRQISSPPQEVDKTFFLAKDYSSIDQVRRELQKQTCTY